MSKLVEINFNPDAKTLRQFGWIALVGFGILAALAYYEKLIFSFGLGGARMPLVMTFAALGTIAALFSLVAPRANRVLYVGLTRVDPAGLSHRLRAFLCDHGNAVLSDYRTHCGFVPDFREGPDAPGLRAERAYLLGGGAPSARQRELLPSVLRGDHVGR